MFLPGSWRNRYFAASSVDPVDGHRIDLAAVRLEQADVVVRQIVRVLAHQRDDVLVDDRARRGPVRIEDDLVDLRIDDRRLAVDLADDRRMAQHDAIVLDRLDLGRRNVDHARSDRRGRRTLTRRRTEVGLKLAEADLRADVHRRIGILAEHAIGRQAVTRLEALDRGIDIGVEGLRHAGARATGRRKSSGACAAPTTSGSTTPSCSFLVAGTIGQPPCATMS